jgi:hypothetical protein
MFRQGIGIRERRVGKNDGHKATLAHMLARVDGYSSGLHGIVNDFQLLLYRKCGFVEVG